MNLKFILVAFLTLTLGGASGSAQSNTDQPTVALVNGHWWNGAASFTEGVYYMRGDVFVARPSGNVTREIDLEGGYIVPGFAEAHHHRICDPATIDSFARAGIVYVGIMNARVSSRTCEAAMYGRHGVEIMNALAGLTEHGAHPSEIGLRFLAPNAIDGEWVHYVDTAADLNRIWRRLEVARPDIMKVFLGYSEDYERLRADPAMPAWYKGLDPNLMPSIVEGAHRRRLRVAVHVLSAHDFDVAVAAGADIIAHMPGFAPGPAFTPDQPLPWLLDTLNQPERYLISARSAQTAARRGVAVMTTMSGVEELPSPLPPGADAYVAFQQRVTGANVATLRRAGVRLLIGSDRYEFNSLDEAAYLVRQGYFTPQQALRSLTVDTPRSLFPERAIGSLAPNAEATFVVLRRNPLQDFEAVHDASVVYKRGVVLARH